MSSSLYVSLLALARCVGVSILSVKLLADIKRL